MQSMEEMIQAAQKAAETIQTQMNDVQAKLDAIEITGEAGGGLVKVRASAKGRILGVSIDDSLFKPEEKQMVEDLVTAAFNDARGKADRVSEEEMKKIQGGMGLPPGFNSARHGITRNFLTERSMASVMNDNGTPQDADTRALVSDEEWAVRVDLAAAYRLVAFYGWDDLIFTHLSARVPGPDHHFLINPYDMMFEEITASSLVKIDVEGQPVIPTAHPVNPAGFTIHSALHMNCEAAGAVMHVHTPCGQAVSAMEFGLLEHTQTGMIARHDIAYHDYEGIATDLEERERLVLDMGDKHAMILRNHGTLTIGKNVAECFLRLYFLERACETQVAMLSAGRDNLNNPPQGTPEKVQSQTPPAGIGMVANGLAWPALLRKLDRMGGGFRE